MVLILLLLFLLTNPEKERANKNGSRGAETLQQNW